MSILAHASVSPSVRKALGELSTLLDEYGYTPHARDQVVAYTSREGTPTGCMYLDPGDEQDASEVFVAELEPAPFDHESWDRDQSVTFDVAMLAEGSHPYPIPVTGDDDRMESTAADRRSAAPPFRVGVLGCPQPCAPSSPRASCGRRSRPGAPPAVDRGMRLSKAAAVGSRTAGARRGGRGRMTGFRPWSP